MTKTPATQLIHEESTYQLLIRSEERERGLIEALVYLLLVIATATAIWLAGHQPVELGARTTEQISALQS